MDEQPRPKIIAKTTIRQAEVMIRSDIPELPYCTTPDKIGNQGSRTRVFY
jgi:hypothetical protein